MRKTIFSAVLFLFFGNLLFSGCHSVESQAVAPPEVLAEFKIEGGAKPIFLPVTFDGKEYQFILDTGATTTVFDVSLKDKLGRRFLWPVKGKAAGGKTIKVELFRIPQAYLGPLSLKDCGLIAVIDLELLSSTLGRKIHGLIGMDFLKKHIVQIDFDERLISFHKSTSDGGIFSFLRPQKNVHPDWGEKVPIKYKLFSSLPYINSNVDGNKVSFLIDTGAFGWSKKGSVTLSGNLESRIFEKVRSETFSGTKKSMITTVAGKVISDSRKFTVIGRFAIGSFEYKDFIFEESYESILGIPFLCRHLVTFDFPNHKMYLKKRMGFDRPSDTKVELKGLDFAMHRKYNNIFVSSINPNGLAYRKGIRQDDIMLKIGEQDVASYGLVELVEFLLQLRKQEDEFITFTFKRGNDIIHISFRKNDIVSEND